MTDNTPAFNSPLGSVGDEPPGPTTPTILALLHELEQLRGEMLALAAGQVSQLAEIPKYHRAGAINLLHYLALRRRDIRELQGRLGELGLSRLGRSESGVMHAIESVISVLARLAGVIVDPPPTSGSAAPRTSGRRLLARNTDLLLGPEPSGRTVRVMVTMPTEAASDYELVRDLLACGMDCMRINCAHDAEPQWASMIANLRKAEAETGRRCRVHMDVAGSKLRTGPMSSGPSVAKCRPTRDAYGRVIHPARIWLTSSRHPEPAPQPASASVPVGALWLSQLDSGQEVRLVDARGARRVMTIGEASGANRWAEADQTIYLTPGLALRTTNPGSGSIQRTRIGTLPPKPQAIVLKPDDRLILTRSLEPGEAARYDAHGALVAPAHIGVTLPEFFDAVKVGDPVWLDDGKFGSVVCAVDPGQVMVAIHHAPPSGAKLREGKGINAPDTALRVDSLAEEDLRALPFIAAHADSLGYSFVRTEADVHDLQHRLAALSAESLGIVLKIETRVAFENLPSLLLAAMRSRVTGVMIARGDLAVECGYERLAEVQEEILWIAEAAHAPVIWATQVLETLTKTGMPTRSEITDAAMGERAECVMLNKGPYVVEAVRTLDNILRRMQMHQKKKRTMLRRLQLATGFGAAKATPP